MRNYYTGRNYYHLTENNQNFYKTARAKPNSIFRNFLIKENADNSTKYFRFKKKEILPEYTNIRKKINTKIKAIKSYYDIKNTIFKEIKSKDIIAYSKFAKDMTLYFFGPKGKITQNNLQLKKYYDSHKKEKVGLNTKIYAGRWEYYDDTTKFNRYLSRLKSNRKKILKIGGHFSTEDDIAHKIHDLYVKKKKIDKIMKIKEEKREEKNNEIKKKILENNKRRFSMTNDIHKINIFNSNIFEYTSIDPYTRGNSVENINTNKIYGYHHKSPMKLPNILKENNLREFIINETDNIDNKDKKRKSKAKYKKYNLNKIKNIFIKENIKNKMNKEKIKHFKTLKISINSKLNSIIEPSKNLLDNIHTIKKNNETHYTYRNNNHKYKEDIKVIGEDDKRDNDENMNEFVKNNYKKQLIDKKATIPIKIHFSYYDQSKSTIHNGIKDFIRNIGRKKEEEREKKYHKNIRDIFHNNCKTIEQLGMNLDSLKIKTNL